MIELIGYFLPGIIGFALLLLVVWLAIKMPTIELESKYKSLGRAEGKSKEEIIKVVGSPQTVCTTNGVEVLMWQRSGFSLTIGIGSDGICRSVSTVKTR